MSIAHSRSDHPTEHSGTIEDVDARLRGRVIHRALELLCTRSIEDVVLKNQLASEFCMSNDDERLHSWCEEARATLASPECSAIFQAGNAQTFNELPILYRHNDQDVYGIIDRLVVYEKEILLIDYKTHQFDDPSMAASAAQAFSRQLDLYREGIQRLWPQHTIKTGVLFTTSQQLIWLQ
jgi:ATP-dependent helicase/nuclease subunit A